MTSILDIDETSEMYIKAQLLVWFGYSSQSVWIEEEVFFTWLIHIEGGLFMEHDRILNENYVICRCIM